MKFVREPILEKKVEQIPGINKKTIDSFKKNGHKKVIYIITLTVNIISNYFIYE